MKIKTTVRYHFIPVRIAIINKSTNNKYWPGCGKKRTLMHCWWECNWCSHCRKQYLKKLKMGLPYDRQFHFWEYIQRNPKHWFARIYVPLVHCSIIYNSQDLEAAQVPISKWLDKKAVVHLPSGIILGHKKKGILPFVTAWMDLKSIMLSEIRQSEKDKYHIIILICGI